MKISKILRRKQNHPYLENVKLAWKYLFFIESILVCIRFSLLCCYGKPFEVILGISFSILKTPRKMQQINMWPCLWSSCDHPWYVCSFISHVHFSFCALGVKLFAIELLIETRELVYVNLLPSVDSVGHKSGSVWERKKGKELTMVFDWSNNDLTPHAWP
jgi:hypothetical protein